MKLWPIQFRYGYEAAAHETEALTHHEAEAGISKHAEAGSKKQHEAEALIFRKLINKFKSSYFNKSVVYLVNSV